MDGGGGATTDSARRADEALDRLIDKACAESDNGRELADFFVERASALAEEFNAKERRDVRGFRDELVGVWLSGQEDVAVVGAAVFVRGVLEPLGSYPQAATAALGADLALVGAVPRWAGNEIIRAVAALFELPLTEVEQQVFARGPEPAGAGSRARETSGSAGSAPRQPTVGGVRRRVQNLLIFGFFAAVIVALGYGVAEVFDRASAPTRAVQANFDEQFPDGRIASRIEHVQDGEFAFTAIVNGVVHRCVATSSGDALECAPGME